MPPESQDREYIKLASEELQDFLLSGEVYWPMGRLRLSMGQLLLYLTNQSAREQTEDSSTEFSLYQQQILQTRDRWRSLWERKAVAEMPMRLNLWRNFLSEYSQDHHQGARDYPREVRWRVMLELLSLEAAAIPPEVSMALAALDQRLQAVFLPGQFIWDAALTGVYPPTPYWFLYGNVRG
jgi:hypothetical protein